MRLAKLFFFPLFIVWLLISAGAHATEPLAVGKGDFDFVDASIGREKPVHVWYYKPAGLERGAKIMFVMHGVDRNGEKYRDRWTHHAEKYKFLLVVPEFQEKFFATKEYQFGNVTDSHSERWSFWIVEHLFDAIRERESLSSETYLLYGHSAGAQFVHRLMIFLPSPRAEIAFACNAGSYTMPMYPGWLDSSFPMNLDRKIVDESRLANVFSRRLVVMLGEDDTDENDKHVPKSVAAMAEGANRFERGQKFFATARTQAAAMKAPLNWELVTVPGVGHSDTGMSKAVMRYLFEK